MAPVEAGRPGSMWGSWVAEIAQDSWRGAQSWARGQDLELCSEWHPGLWWVPGGRNSDLRAAEVGRNQWFPWWYLFMVLQALLIGLLKVFLSTFSFLPSFQPQVLCFKEAKQIHHLSIPSSCCFPRTLYFFLCLVGLSSSHPWSCLLILFRFSWKTPPWKALPNYLLQSRSILSCLCVHAKSCKLCLTLCDPMDCSLLDSSVHWVLHARILEWVAMPSSREPSWPRDPTYRSWDSWITGGFFFFLNHWATREAPPHVCMMPF